ncbi:PrgI family protein [Patescibacteria group bacterium]|nr:PrgI family protein [Patescibacteria group bacterium]MBU4274351.1 PrgI family protein [Patescibacteria group bacterium]MBU4367541.1 PrgI family protein [Patescibacteria group bacterium]MBU4461582.1 PrgI family protein [Patescibacteria group bacterium]MCG2699479.1 PrgI family protein [Candidatus Parcubacteria bacterium]
MEQYPVPQFIEEEARMAFFLTVKQFVYLVIAGAILFILYAILPFFLFIVAAIIVGGSAVLLGFFKINGIPLLTVLLNSIGFITGAKNYTWKKKESLYPFKTIRRPEIKKIEEDKTLKIGQKSGLKKLRTKVELKIK